MQVKAGDFMSFEGYPVIVTEIGDLSIHTVLDNGFIQHSELAPEVHSHAFYELLVAVDGQFAADIQDADREARGIVLNTGDVCLIPPGIYHSTRGISDSPVKLALRFSCKAAGGSSRGEVFGDAMRVLCGCTHPRLISPPQKIYGITRELREEINGGGIASREYIGTLLSQLYILLFRLLDTAEAEKGAVSVIPSGTEDNRQIQIEEYIFNHFGEQITEEDLAREMHLSKRQLSRVLRQLFGKSFRQMLIEARLNRAAQLLCDTDLSVEEIATQVGYTSLSGFYTAFRGHFSISVGAYRRTFGGKK